MTTSDWLSLVIVLICLLLSAYFAGSETALTASSRASMTRLEKHGNQRASLVNRLLQQRERLFGALLFGNNAVNIAASALAAWITFSALSPMPAGMRIASGIRSSPPLPALTVCSCAAHATSTNRS